MKRIAMLVATLLAAMLLASGAALALTEVGGPTNDVLRGTNGADRLDGRVGNDTIWGLGGDDPRLVGGFGNDEIGGGRGEDYLLGSGIAGTGAARHDNGDKGSDTLYGNAGDDHMVGGLGPDRLSGGLGDDCLVEAAGEFGSDRAEDVLRGGDGNDDILAWSGSGAEDRISCGEGFDVAEADKGIDRVGADCERVYYKPQG
jgi:Ca2+-binding RTX toxin-like protein